MRGNVAVHEPGAGVVSPKGDDDGASAGEKDDVAAGRVVEVEGEVL